MTDLLLAKPQLDASWIDWSVGEATITRNNLFKHFPNLYDPTILSLHKDLTLHDFEYQPPAGHKDLVDLLEAKHQAPVIITNGAKQALSAVFAALKKRAIPDLYLQPIYWALLPPLARFHGLDVVHAAPNDYERFKRDNSDSAYLLVAPGNPDGICPSQRELRNWSDHFTERMMPFIFDGAYYTHSYLPMEYDLEPIGDVQIFSFSKMLGLSSIRGGYIVFHDTSYYKDILAYQEMMTVGVSMLTQKYLCAIIQMFKKDDKAVKAFETDNYQELRIAKKLLREIPDTILEVPDNIEESNGMFAWVGIKDAEAFKKAKLHIVSGEPFGDKSKVRLNLGIGNETLKECVKRLREIQ